MTLAHLADRGHGQFKGVLVGLGVVRQAHRDIGNHANAKGGRIEHGAVAADHAAAFQLLHPAQAGRGRQADLVRQIQIADPAVLGKFAQYVAAYGI